jgi:transcriptional regulator with XRE-family HTH domain
MEIRRLRKSLGLSRNEFARFLGVSEVTVARWETSQNLTEPKGLQAVLLRAVSDAARAHSTTHVAGLVRSSGTDHRAALRSLLDAAGVPEGS